METLKSTKVDWKKLAVVFAIVFLTGLIVGLGVWYYMNQQVQVQAEYYEDQLDKQELIEAPETETETEIVATDKKEDAKKIDWKDYSNSNYQVSFRYPGGHIARENIYDIDGLEFLSVLLIKDEYLKAEAGFPMPSVNVYPKKASDTLTFIDTLVEGVNRSSISKKIIAGREVYVYVEEGMGKYDVYVFQNSNNSYAVRVTNPKEGGLTQGDIEILIESIQI